jgi:hypothetical protein
MVAIQARMPVRRAVGLYGAIEVRHLQGPVFADPTERTVPFGELPARDQESTVLHLTPEGSSVGVSPGSGPEANLEEQRFLFTVDDTGRGSGTFAVVARGEPARSLKYTLLRGAKKLEERLEEHLDLEAHRVSALTRTDAPDFASTATVEGTLEARRLLARSPGDVALMRLTDFAPRWLPGVGSSGRRTDLAWRFAGTQKGEVTVKLPNGARATRLPPEVKLEGEFLSFSLSWSSEREQVVVRRELVRRQRVVPVARFDAFRRELERIHLAEAEAAVVRFGASR